MLMCLSIGCPCHEGGECKSAKKVLNIKPSEIIQNLAIEMMKNNIDPMYNGGYPGVDNYLNAILQYLDEQEHLHRNSVIK